MHSKVQRLPRPIYRILRNCVLQLVHKGINMRTGYIYKITNTINGKVYIGQTIQSVTKRWYDHVSQAKTTTKPGHFQRAILKYGRDAFTVEIVEKDVPRDLLDDKESEHISRLDTYNNGYNSTSGGQREPTGNVHYIPTDEHKQNMSKAKKGKKLNWSKQSLEAVRQAKIGTNNPNYGKKMPRIVCEHCSKNVAKNIYSQYHGDKCKLKPKSTIGDLSK